jgi:predicted PurR-regulated permease PerM
MNIRGKIEEIRKQPEHIRLRYVWGAVAVSMIFIIIIWIFSMMTIFGGNSAQSQNPDISPIKDQLQNFKNEVPSIKNISGDSLNATQNNSTEGQTTTNQDNSQNAASNTASSTEDQLLNQ